MSLPSSRRFSLLFVLILLMTACTAPAPETTTQATEPAVPAPSATTQDADHMAAPIDLPQLAPVALADDEKPQVVATTNLIADVVRQVGGEHIDLYAMLPIGADPHSYQPMPQDLRMLTDADVIFVNGLGLEEAMALALEDYAGKRVVVNTGVDTAKVGDHAGDAEEHAEEHEEEHAHGEADPHTWFSVPVVEVWTYNISQVLSDLDPANAAAYQANADAYAGELAALHAELEAQVALIPADQRKLVTDHDSLGYLAAEYGFQISGSMIPSSSTLAEPSAQQLAALQDQIDAEGVKAIFVGTTVNPQLAAQLAEDLGIAVVPIYTGSLSEADGPAATYLDFMRYNIGAIVEALQ